VEYAPEIVVIGNDGRLLVFNSTLKELASANVLVRKGSSMYVQHHNTSQHITTHHNTISGVFANRMVVQHCTLEWPCCFSIWQREFWCFSSTQVHALVASLYFATHRSFGGLEADTRWRVCSIDPKQGMICSTQGQCCWHDTKCTTITMMV
jgi:hypothetical protein